MKRGYFIGLDTHGSFCEMAVFTSNGKRVHGGKCKTTITDLRALIDQVPTPRIWYSKKVRWPTGCFAISLGTWTR